MAEKNPLKTLGFDGSFVYEVYQKDSSETKALARKAIRDVAARCKRWLGAVLHPDRGTEPGEVVAAITEAVELLNDSYQFDEVVQSFLAEQGKADREVFQKLMATEGKLTESLTRSKALESSLDRRESEIVDLEERLLEMILTILGVPTVSAKGWSVEEIKGKLISLSDKALAYVDNDGMVTKCPYGEKPIDNFPAKVLKIIKTGKRRGPDGTKPWCAGRLVGSIDQEEWKVKFQDQYSAGDLSDVFAAEAFNMITVYTDSPDYMIKRMAVLRPWLAKNRHVICVNYAQGRVRGQKKLQLLLNSAGILSDVIDPDVITEDL